ncbi:MAG TPA: GPO family capsid scaffolding protein [bacterium]
MLQTDWLKVATAGRTVDGREIKPEWLEKIAAAYSPKVYTASVNSEHFFYPGLGYVTAVRAAQDEEGRTALYAKVAPTAELLARYQNRRQLFFSMELRSDFPAKGDLYLTGLAITDIPASQGLEPARFYAGAGERTRFFDTARLEAEPGGEGPGGGAEPARASEPASEETPPGWWSALWESLRPHLGRRPDDNTQEQSDAMTKEERQAFQALEEQVTTLQAELAELAGKFAAQPEADPEPEAAADPVAEAMERFTAELQAKIAEAVAPLAERIGKLEGYLAEPVEGEQGEVTGPAGGEGFVF